MAMTRKGIYHNLRESTYTVSNTETVFFFSSLINLNKFLDKYPQHRESFLQKTNELMHNPPLNMDMLSDIALYKTIEKRGFHVWLKGVTINCEELHRYALRKMTEKNTLDWQKMQRPKLSERVKTMGLTYDQK